MSEAQAQIQLVDVMKLQAVVDRHHGEVLNFFKTINKELNGLHHR